jgi:hypothetical protein
MHATKTKHRSTSLPLWCALALAAAGCSQAPASNAGTARFALSSALLAPGVVEVIVTVGPGGGTAFTPFSVNLSNVQGTWSGFITNIPAGSQRSFDVVANDAAHVTLQSGTARADVVAGQSAMVVVNLGSAVPSDPFANKAPVIDYVSASQTSVLPGGTVRLAISAHDPDQDPMTILWSAACGTIDAPASTVVTWTAPATTGPCQITAKASDNRGASVSVYLALDVPPASTGGVLVEVQDGGNASPVITRVVADVRYRSPVEGNLTAEATDANGDPLTYAWTSNCPSVSFATPAAGGTTFTNSDGSRSCVVTVTVADGKGGRVTGDVTLPPNILFNLAPVITRTVQPSVDLADPRLAQPVSAGDAVLLSVEAKDPEGLALSFTWTTNAGTLDGQVDVTTSPGKSVIVFHAGTSLPADAKVTLTVRDVGNETATHDFNFKASTGTGPCANQPNGTTCDDGNPCTTTSSCQGGICTGGTPVACTAPVACKLAGVCQTSGPGAGTCAYADAPTGTGCDDGRACTSPDTCAAGVCMSGASTCVAGESCSAAGVCVPGVCVPACTGKVCGPDGCGGTCGTCTAGTCNDTTGQCVTATTGVVPQRVHALRLTPPAGVAVDATGATFVVGNISVITDVDFQTKPPPAPPINLKSQGGSDAFVAKYDAAGDIVWAFTIQDNNATAITDQFATLVSVNQAGTVGIIGKFSGTVTFGTTSAGGANPVPYIAGVDGATGARLWVNGYDLGSNGLFQSVSSNPGQALNRFAACGFADAAATGLDPAAVFGGVQDAVIGAWSSTGAKLWGRQIGGPAGSNTTENCAAVAIDGNGDVIASGQFDGATIDLGGGFVLTGPGSGNRKFMWVARFNGATGATLAAASFNGTVGTAIPRSLSVDPAGRIAVGGSFSGNLTIGAAMTSTGSEDGFVALLGTNFTPAWNAVRLGGTVLDLVRSVATTSAGDIIAVGNFGASSAAFRAANGGFDTSGGVSLLSKGGADIFVAKLNGATGSTDGATGYGNTGTQSGDVVSVNRFGANQVRFTGTSPGTVSFGGPSFTAAGPTDAALVFANIQ